MGSGATVVGVLAFCGACSGLLSSLKRAAEVVAEGKARSHVEVEYLAHAC